MAKFSVAGQVLGELQEIPAETADIFNPKVLRRGSRTVFRLVGVLQQVVGARSRRGVVSVPRRCLGRTFQLFHHQVLAQTDSIFD